MPSRASACPRLLIFVIAYQAESTLVQVLERIPRSVFRDWECEILVVDDASADRTFDIGREYQEAHPDLPLTVLRNTYNQGYGGNQKVGYAYAIAEGFDVVAMVHGDGQYAPEELPRLLEPLRKDRADAVFGSRMMTRFGALQGGMPLYKFVGNKILTGFQNAVLGTRLSEFHSGYRVYRISTLARLPLELNSNDFHFDTEIILQLLNARARPGGEVLLLVAKSRYEELGGLDEAYDHEAQDADLGLKPLSRSLRNVVSPALVALQLESATRRQPEWPPDRERFARVHGPFIGRTVNQQQQRLGLV